MKHSVPQPDWGHQPKDQYVKVHRKSRPVPAPPRISVAAKARHAAQATSRIVRAAASGKPIRVSDEERDRRLAICRACDLWSEGGNVGLGECRHSKCGCTRFKHGLATETCPMGKW